VWEEKESVWIASVSIDDGEYNSLSFFILADVEIPREIPLRPVTLQWMKTP